MYLSDLDIVAITIALVMLMALVITSAVANARLTRERNEWRQLAISYEREFPLDDMMYDNRTGGNNG